MQKSILGRTGLLISPVVYGAIIHMNESAEKAAQLVTGAVDRGVNYFDVAPSYGDAEVLMGPALEPHRSAVYLACKTGKRKRQEARDELLQSLKNLKTDYFDVYQIHALTTQDELDTLFGPDGAMETFVWAKREGLIRHIGFSTHNERVALNALDLFDFETVLFPMNWAMGLTTGWGNAIAEKVRQTGAGLLAMKTLVERLWLPDEVKTYPKSWCKPLSGDVTLMRAAMKYGLAKGATTLIPPGNVEHFEFMLDQIESCQTEPLDNRELAMLQQAAEQVKDQLIFKI